MDSLHTRALSLSRQHRRTESELVAVLSEIEEAKLHRAMGYSSLFAYTVSALGLSESVAYALIAVARKAREVSALQVAVAEQSLSVQRASRIVAALTVENADELIGFAATHTQRETDREVARLTDRLGEKRENLKVSLETLELLRKAQAVMASRKKSNLKLDEALKLVLDEFLDRREPVRKAERAQVREKNSVQTRAAAKPAPGRRRSLPARTKHAVIIRDQARCSFVDPAGNRCTNERWLQLHHVQPISRGGSDEPANLATLCPFHHDLVHQLGLPIEGQVNWIREPVRAYQH